MNNEPVERCTYTIAEFCKAYRIGSTTFFKLRHLGKAPRLMQVGSRVLISVEAAAEWRKAREDESPQ